MTEEEAVAYLRTLGFTVERKVDDIRSERYLRVSMNGQFLSIASGLLCDDPWWWQHVVESLVNYNWE